MFVLDSHCDTPSQILRLRDLSLDNEHAHVDFPKLKRGGVDGAFFALYVPGNLETEEAFEYSQRLLEGVERAVEANSSSVAFATDSAQAFSNKQEGRFSVFLGLENGSPIGNSFDRLKWFYDRGVRYVTLCHSSDNQICDSCASKVKRWGGLSPFGKELVAEMNSLGILIDVSHISDASFYDVLKYSDRPVVATHSCCRALCSHPRNMTDDMIRSLASAGGVIQINFYPLFLDSGFAEVLSGSGLEEKGGYVEKEFINDPSDPLKRAAWNRIQDEIQSLPRPSFKLIADHIDHVVALAGIDHVGIGSDFDGIEVTPEGMEDISMMPKLFEELRRRGYSEADLEKMASGNFFRILE
ncbi:MAG: dipeptidase [Bacteroidales bacterium]|nr:dipeptidase [Bacteroidales bacterium]